MTPHVQAHHHRASSSSPSHVKIIYPSDVDADGSDLEEIMAISEEEVVGKKIRILRGPRPRRKTKAQTEAAGGIATQEDRERELVGSLTTSGKYKTQGLIKKVSFLSSSLFSSSSPRTRFRRNSRGEGWRPTAPDPPRSFFLFRLLSLLDDLCTHQRSRSALGLVLQRELFSCLKRSEGRVSPK